MTEKLKPSSERPLPIGWPKNKPLPTYEECEKAVRKMEEDILEAHEKLKGKISDTDPDFLDIRITI